MKSKQNALKKTIIIFIRKKKLKKMKQKKLNTLMLAELSMNDVVA